MQSKISLKVKKKVINYFNRCRIRIAIAWKILFIHDHFFCIYISRKQFIELIKDNKCSEDYKLSYLGLQMFHVMQMVNQISDESDTIEIALDKAAFEAKAETLNKK